MSTAVLVAYYTLVILKLKNHRSPALEERQQSPVSVIICARNEAENLQKHLPLVLDQDHSAYEVIVIDDASWDNSDEILYSLSQKYSQLSVVSIDESQKTRSGKKFALTLGIKKAKHPNLVFIDADCTPASRLWLREMSDGLETGVRLGYGKYAQTPGLLNLLVRFETWSTALLYLSAALSKRAYMGVGRNLSYRREVYDAQGGFRSHYHVPSGDDDLLVNAAVSSFPIEIRTAPESHTVSIAPSTWGEWIRQKKRHMSVTSMYSGKSKVFIGTYYWAQVLFYLAITSALLIGLWKLVFIVWASKTLIHLLISHFAGAQLQEKSTLVLLPILEPILLLIQIVSGVMMKVQGPSAWK